MSDLNLEAIPSKDEETRKMFKCTEGSSTAVEEKQDISVPSVKLLREIASGTRTDNELRFDLNPYNKCIF